jgi:hypothetical protein
MLFFSPKPALRLKAITAKLADDIAASHPVEKCAVLILANMNLALAARTYSPLLLTKPKSAPADASAKSVAALIKAHDAISDILEKDPSSRLARQNRCHLRALAVSACTAGMQMDALLPGRTTAVWKAAWGGRPRVRDTVVWLRRYEADAGVEAVPRKADGSVPTDIDLIAAGSSLPAFFTRKA